MTELSEVYASELPSEQQTNKLPWKKYGGKTISSPKMSEDTKLNVNYSLYQ